MKEETKRVPLSVEALAEMKARLAAATPGPWWINERGCRPEDGPDELVVVASASEIAALDYSKRGGDDAVFIAAAPTDMAALIAEVERLRFANHHYGTLMDVCRQILRDGCDEYMLGGLEEALEEVVNFLEASDGRD